MDGMNAGVSGKFCQRDAHRGMRLNVLPGTLKPRRSAEGMRRRKPTHLCQQLGEERRERKFEPRLLQRGFSCYVPNQSSRAGGPNQEKVATCGGALELSDRIGRQLHEHAVETVATDLIGMVYPAALVGDRQRVAAVEMATKPLVVPTLEYQG